MHLMNFGRDTKLLRSFPLCVCFHIYQRLIEHFIAMINTTVDTVFFSFRSTVFCFVPQMYAILDNYQPFSFVIIAIHTYGLINAKSYALIISSTVRCWSAFFFSNSFTLRSYFYANDSKCQSFRVKCVRWRNKVIHCLTSMRLRH